MGDAQPISERVSRGRDRLSLCLFCQIIQHIWANLYLSEGKAEGVKGNSFDMPQFGICCDKHVFVG